MSIKIIVNADDLGMSEPVNEAIFQGLQRGAITSATILSNGAAVKDAIGKLRFFPRSSFGVHLNLTEFAPLCDASFTDLAVILNENRCFDGNAIREIPISRRMRRAIFREWCCQIDNLIRLGLEPTHFDGHHHVHTIPQLLPVLAALRRRYKIRKIRLSKNMYTNSQRPAGSLLTKKSILNLALRMIGFKTTRIFTDVTTFFQMCAKHPPRATSIELMAHPGSSDLEETRLLEQNWPSRLAYPVALMSYKEL